MKGMLTLKKSVVMLIVCLAVLCLPGYSEPTPEQVKERTDMLFEAMSMGDLERAKVCIKLGADVNAIFRGSTALECAIDYDYKDMVELLIKSGVDMNAKNFYGTALIFALEKKKKDMVELLIKAGADVNAKDRFGRPALTVAIREGYEKDVFELLIKAGADVNAKDRDGDTALMNQWINEDIAKLLISAGADVNAKDNYGNTVLMRVNEAVVEPLIKAGAVVDGATLIWAVKERPELLEALIKVGVNPNAKDSEGISVLTYAILYGHNDIAELLRAVGAKE